MAILGSDPQPSLTELLRKHQENRIDWEDNDTGPPLLTILDKAKKTVDNKREEEYGHPKHHFSKTASVFNALKGTNLTAQDIADFFMVDKLVRRQTSPGDLDHLVDIAGYARCAERLQE